MRILFDQGTPVPLRRSLLDHVVETVYERGWSTLQNGALLTAAEGEGFEVFITTDQNLKYQQQVRDRQLAIIVLSTTSWPRIRQQLEAIQAVVATTTAGSYHEITIP